MQTKSNWELTSWLIKEKNAITDIQEKKILLKPTPRAGIQIFLFFSQDSLSFSLFHISLDYNQLSTVNITVGVEQCILGLHFWYFYALSVGLATLLYADARILLAENILLISSSQAVSLGLTCLCATRAADCNENCALKVLLHSHSCTFTNGLKTDSATFMQFVLKELDFTTL